MIFPTRFILILTTLSFVATGCIKENSSSESTISHEQSIQHEETDKHDGHEHPPEESEHAEHDHSKEDHNEHKHKEHTEEHDHAKRQWLTLPSKDKHDDEGEHGHGDENGHGDEQRVVLSANEIEEFQIETAVAAHGTFEKFISVSGEVVLNEDHVAHVTSRVSGFARKILKTLGDVVRKGELLAVIDSAELAEAISEYDLSLTQRKIAESKYRISQLNFDRQRSLHDNIVILLGQLGEGAPLEKIEKGFEGKSLGESRSKLFKIYSELSLTKAAFQRETSLREKKVSSESDYLSAKNGYESAKSEFVATFDEVSFQNQLQLIQTEQLLEEAKQGVQTAQQQIRASEAKLRSFGFTQPHLQQLQKELPEETDTGRYELRSPISGVIIERHITLGERLENTDKPFVVADFRSVWVNLTLYEKDLEHIRVGQPVTLSTQGKNISSTNLIIQSISPTLDPETRTATARVVLENQKGFWRPGMFVSAKVGMSLSEQPLLIPSSAIQTLEGKTVIFIQEGRQFKPTHVEIGRRSQQHVEVTHGLKIGQKYVVKGAFTLKAQLSKANFDDGHNH